MADATAIPLRRPPQRPCHCLYHHHCLCPPSIAPSLSVIVLLVVVATKMSTMIPLVIVGRQGQRQGCVSMMPPRPRCHCMKCTVLCCHPLRCSSPPPAPPLMLHLLPSIPPPSPTLPTSHLPPPYRGSPPSARYSTYTASSKRSYLLIVKVGLTTG